MSKGNSVILTSPPKGNFQEGIITDTSIPGMVLEMKPTTLPVGGRMSYRARSAAAGSKGDILLLLNDGLQGKLAVGAATAFGPGGAGDAYVANTRCFLYEPVMGEELNILIGSVAGTADDVAIGDLFGVNNDGKWKANSAYTSAPMKANEVITDPTADYMLWATYLGNNA